ncbi:MAG: 7-carboxy-7-deazaguanine synthase [Cellvibrionaceae bacterium]|jgi:7-carboxy-7-deazaguanine synthase
MSDMTLRITETFLSIQGEAARAGYPTAFIRLTGCPLRCRYCDSEYAFFGGQKYSIDSIISLVEGYGVQHVCVTGGEPLAQPNCLRLLSMLCDKGYKVSLETSGALPVKDVDKRVCIVMDLKTPASTELSRNDYSNINYLSVKDEVKFIICDKQDFSWAVFKISEYQLTERVGSVFLSPSYGELSAEILAEWVLAERLPIRLQIQLHKTLWGDKPGV